ncbi:MAG: ABC transporter substrate-binding protein [bacterium]|nr:ABC transporter substrate-binding protein [bacterium]
MKKNIIGIVLVLVSVLGVVLFIWQEQDVPAPRRTYHIAILARGRGSYEVAIDSFKKTLTGLGYHEGEDVAYDIRYVSTKEELDTAARDFVNNGVDLVNTYSTPATQAMYQATQVANRPIPIVFGSMGDALAAGVIKGIQNSGTNVTGVISSATELTVKRLDLLKELKPDIRTVAFPHSASELHDVAADKSVAIAMRAAPDIGIKLVLFPVVSKEDNAIVAKKITRRIAEGMIVGGDSLIWSSLEAYAEQARQEKILFAAFDADQVKRGALVGFGPDYVVSGQQVASIAHLIFQGKRPEDIPIETPRKLLLAVNLDTARAIGFTIPPEFLKKADVIIDNLIENHAIRN